MIAVDKPNAAHFGPHFNDRGRSFDLQILYHSDRVAILQHVAHDIAHLGLDVQRRALLPFVAAFWADQ